MEIPQKPPQNDMTDFPPHFNTANYITGTLSLFAFVVAQSAVITVDI